MENYNNTNYNSGRYVRYVPIENYNTSGQSLDNNRAYVINSPAGLGTNDAFQCLPGIYSNTHVYQGS